MEELSPEKVCLCSSNLKKSNLLHFKGHTNMNGPFQGQINFLVTSTIT